MGFLAQLEGADPQGAARLLLARWEANRLFFEEHLPLLAKLFQTPTQRYELSIDAAGVNLRHKATREPVYPIDASGRSTLFQAARDWAFNPPHNPKWQPRNAQTGPDREDEQAFEITAWGINQIVDRLKKDPDYRPGMLHYDGKNQLPAIVSYGLLSGAHLTLLDEAGLLNNGVLIYEPEPDFLLLSAYFVDYAKLLAPDRENLLVVKGHLNPLWLRRFFSARLISRGFIRLETVLYEHPAFYDAQARIEEAAKESLRGWGTAEDELYGVRNKLANLGQTSFKLLCNPVRGDWPIAVVGNGPSLDRLLPFLKANREGLIIFSAGTALKPLRAAGIRPDFQIEIERRDHVAGVLQAADLGDIPLLGADLLHPSTLAAARESYLFIRDTTATEQLWKPRKVVRFSNPLVGNAALALALEFSKEVYLCGLDVGFRKDQKQHAKHSHYDNLKDSGGEQFPARGNFSADVWTNSLFSLSRSVLEKAIAAHPEARVFNLSDGAYIQGADALNGETLQLKAIDRVAATAQIKAAFVPGGCFDRRDFDLGADLDKVRTVLLSLLDTSGASDKRRLFQTMDNLLKASVILRRDHPISGTLIGGTFWHLINALFKGLLQLQRQNVEDCYRQGAEAIKKSLEKITVSYDEPTTSPPKTTGR